jgi:ABC-type transporter Mla subunit MlaD
LTDIDLAKESGDGDKLNEAINRLNEATQTLAARLMDAAATKALRDKRMAEISASNLR